jgi:hypothetical protein
VEKSQSAGGLTKSLCSSLTDQMGGPKKGWKTVRIPNFYSLHCSFSLNKTTNPMWMALETY